VRYVYHHFTILSYNSPLVSSLSKRRLFCKHGISVNELLHTPSPPEKNKKQYNPELPESKSFSYIAYMTSQILLFHTGKFYFKMPPLFGKNEVSRRRIRLKCYKNTIISKLTKQWQLSQNPFLGLTEVFKLLGDVFFGNNKRY
jgi:hypothetical protein